MSMRVSITAMLMLAPALAACAAPKQTSAVHAQAGDAMTATRLYFGMSIKGGGSVSDADWRTFLARRGDAALSRRVDRVAGARPVARPALAADILREQTRVLLLLHKNSKKARTGIAAIIAHYKSRFRQRSVLRIDAPVRVTF